MNEKSLKINFIMNIILTCSAYIIPLITFPYVSRVLQAAGNGQVNFALSVVNYFVMFTMLGLPTYGIRVCANVKEDRNALSKTVHELLILNIITCVIGYIVLGFLMASVSKLSEYKSLIWIFSSLMLLNCISVEWLYKALEEYSYITIRSLTFKVLAVFFMFMFVRSINDTEMYAITMVIGMGGSYIFNLIRLPKVVAVKYVGPYDLRKHIKPIIAFFLLSVSWTIYTNLDVLMLGFVAGDVEVGYYSAATKIKLILVSSVSALGTVLLPRLTQYAEEHSKVKFYSLLKKDCAFIQIMAWFLIGYIVPNARDILFFLSGKGYLPATSSLQIIAFSVLFIGLSTMTGTNMLIPMGKEMITIFATLVGIVIDVILNYILIPIYGASGAAFATVIGEFVILFVECLYLRMHIKQIIDVLDTVKIMIGTLTASCVVVLTSNILFEENLFFALLIKGIIYFVIYGLFMIITKEKFVMEQIKKITCG